MDRIGFGRGMDTLMATDMVIKEVVTDGHAEIGALFKNSDKLKDIVHQRNVWHGGKGICKKLNSASQSKGNDELGLWISAVRNHFWYCFRCCNGNVDNMKEMWISILHRVVDEHEWLLAESGGGKCAHEPLSADDRNKPWLKKNTPAHNSLREVVMDKNILRTLSYYVNFRYFLHI
ncbi:uncharacterized protein [Montipora foliosa]|uniref:uncharacterized protein n=1 Tax=Montipora foliosa TaxID=591990 RepID=UPI0035F13758